MTAFLTPFKQFIHYQWQRQLMVRLCGLSSLVAILIMLSSYVIGYWVPTLHLFWSYYFFGLIFSLLGAIILQISSIIILKSQNKYCFFCFFLFRMVLYGVAIYLVRFATAWNIIAVICGIITFTIAHLLLVSPKKPINHHRELFL